MKKVLICSCLLVFLLTAGKASARDYIRIVGSSTVYPFAVAVVDKFLKKTDFPPPEIVATGSGGGHKLFGAGIGPEYPDITNSSRRIKKSELERCSKNGIHVVEIKIGYDGIVVANSREADVMKLTQKDLFLALAARVPDPAGLDTLIDNPYRTWKEVNANLSAVPIEVLGPPPTSGTRDVFAELVMERGADAFDFIRAVKRKDKSKYERICHSIREDGVYIEAGENDNLIVQMLEAKPSALGIFGFSFLDQNTDKIQGACIDGVAPTFDNIADQRYPVSRPLFFYVKKEHVGKIPGIREYIAEFASGDALSSSGYLAEKGLIPMPKAERMKYAGAALNLTTLEIPDL